MITQFGVVLFILLPSLVVSQCIHCASYVFGRPSTSHQLDTTYTRFSDYQNRCISKYTNSDTTQCSGPCLTVNVTTGPEDNPVVKGVLRDCLSSHSRVKKELKEATDDGANGKCYTKKFIRHRVEHTATYCVCSGAHCNNHGGPTTLFAVEPSGYRPYRKAYRKPSSSISLFCPTLIVLINLFPRV